MQRKWCSELIADFADKGKNDAIDQLFKQMSANLYAAVTLIADGQKPQMSCYSDDFFVGRTELEFLGTQPLTVNTNTDTTEDDSISDEMMSMFKEGK